MPKVQDAFATRGFQNWKLIATTVLRQHELGAFHKEEVERVIALHEATINRYVKNILNTMH